MQVHRGPYQQTPGCLLLASNVIVIQLQSLTHASPFSASVRLSSLNSLIRGSHASGAVQDISRIQKTPI
jgi:hypothetical protein